MANESLSLTPGASTLNEAVTCAHHWVLESPNGAVSRGRCRACGAIKEFRNATTDFVWEEERKSAVSDWSSRGRARSA